MAKRALWPRVRTAVAIFFYACLALGALVFADSRIGRRGISGLRRFYALSRLPERTLGQSWTTPALVRGNLHPAAPRLTPRDQPSALWYAWVEDVRGSGRSTYTVVVCAKQENRELELRQAGRTARLELLTADDKGELLKGGTLTTLPFSQVALDFGRLHRSRLIPEAMRELCGPAIPDHGNLTYHEAYVPIGAPVTVLGCATGGVLSRCGSPPGVISVRGMNYVLRAYANQNLDSIRGAAAFVGIALSLLAAALFKLRRPAADPS